MRGTEYGLVSQIGFDSSHGSKAIPHHLAAFSAPGTAYLGSCQLASRRLGWIKPWDMGLEL